MTHWLQSLTENGFDVFMVVYLAVLVLAYHYLSRWHIDIATKEIKDEIKSLNSNITNHIIKKDKK